MGFIRRNGRVIFIGDKGERQGKASHLTMAKRGAINTSLAGASMAAAALGKKKSAIGLGAAFAASSIHGIFKNVENSYAHGKSKKSFLHGVGRYITNSLAFSGGGIAVGLGVTAASKVAIAGSGLAAKAPKATLTLKKTKGGSYRY